MQSHFRLHVANMSTRIDKSGWEVPAILNEIAFAVRAAVPIPTRSILGAKLARR